MNGDNVEIRATLKRATGRPARDPGDKPVFEVLFRAEVNPTTTRLMAKLGKDATVSIAFDADPQQALPFDEERDRTPTPLRRTTVDGESTVLDTATTGERQPAPAESEPENERRVIPSAGRRRNGTRSPEQVPPSEIPDPTKEPVSV